MGSVAWPVLIHLQTLTDTLSVPGPVQGILGDSSFWAREVS